MQDDLVYRKNVLFEFYKAALHGEISSSVFSAAREIISRAKHVDARDAIEISELLDALGSKTKED